MKQTSNPIQNCVEKNEQIFLQNKIKITKRHRKKLHPLIIRQMQIQTTMRYFIISQRYTHIKIPKQSVMVQMHRQRDSFSQLAGMSTSPVLWKITWIFLKKLWNDLQYYTAIPLLEISPSNPKILCRKTVYIARLLNDYSMIWCKWQRLLSLSKYMTSKKSEVSLWQCRHELKLNDSLLSERRYLIQYIW